MAKVEPQDSVNLSDNKNTTSVTNAMQISRESLIKSDKYSEFNKFFLEALLPNKSYTEKEAEDIVFNYFKKGAK